MAKFVISDEDRAQLKRLVIAAQAGDRDAFGDLFLRFQGVVLAIAIRRLGGNASEAQELCQDVFVQAMQRLSQLRTPEAFAGWLKSITHRMAINRIVRQSGVVATEPSTMAATCIDHATPFTSAVRQERVERVRAGLSRLGEIDRTTLEAFYLHGRSLREMALEFDAPIGTIKRRLHTARKRLSREVDELEWVAV